MTPCSPVSAPTTASLMSSRPRRESSERRSASAASRIWLKRADLAVVLQRHGKRLAQGVGHRLVLGLKAPRRDRRPAEACRPVRSRFPARRPGPGHPGRPAPAPATVAPRSAAAARTRLAHAAPGDQLLDLFGRAVGSGRFRSSRWATPPKRQPSRPGHGPDRDGGPTQARPATDGPGRGPFDGPARRFSICRQASRQTSSSRGTNFSTANSVKIKTAIPLYYTGYPST